MEELPSVQQNNETNEDLKNFFESSKNKGLVYTSHINKLITTSTDDEKTREMSDDLQKLVSVGEEYFRTQSERFIKAGNDASILLNQLVGMFPNNTLPEEFTNPNNYELLEPTEGVFILKIDEELLRKIQPNATAVAVKIEQGISFVIVPRYKDRAINESIWKENIPHETHHLFWKAVMKSGVLEKKEDDKDFQEAFAMYQDELLARMCSGGNLSGYSHISLLDPTSKEKFKTENPEKFEVILNTVSRMNDFLYDLRVEMRRREISGENLIGAVIEAGSFEELEKNFNKCKEYIMFQPITNPNKPVTGFDSPV